MDHTLMAHKTCSEAKELVMMQAKNASSFLSATVSRQHLYVVSCREQEQLWKSSIEMLAMSTPTPEKPWDSLLPQHPKPHSTPAAPASHTPFPPFKCNPSRSCCLAPHARTSRQHRNQAPISSVFFECHCTIELLKWQSTLAVQTCTYLKYS